ncbi:MAG: RluA family pseudouridine synthase [Alphaproteobacteria bacterium]|nr:RluA family pseudouridine synthase [Alphaproteobacteria bacterium]MDE2631476.1 RluA family pseudouridine synthase [Alphaproteobacteria bacterium]
MVVGTNSDIRRAEVLAADAGTRLDRMLAARFADFSRSRLKRLVEQGHVTLDDKPIDDPAFKVKTGQIFTVAFPPLESETIEPQPMDLNIVFEDAHVLVLDKPAGIVVHPAPGNPDRTLVNALVAHCGDSLTGIGGVRRPGIVHRLDKDTSGLMVIAKTEAAHRALSTDFATRRITRAYQALVWGVPTPRTGEIVGPIGRNPRDRKTMAVVAGGKAATTRYKVLKSFGTTAALIECRLGSGRTHQIRVHLLNKGSPIMGDPVYRGRHGAARFARLPPVARQALAGLQRQALHAYLLGFRHPATGEYQEFKTALPSQIVDLLHKLEDI